LQSILKAWELLAKSDINLACSKEIDKRLWAIVKKPIEILTKEKKKEEGHKDSIIKLVDTSIQHFKDIIQDVKSV
jgi:hypothetical protein